MPLQHGIRLGPYEILTPLGSGGMRGNTFAADKPRVWSETRLVNTGLIPLFDLAPDGKRFAVLLNFFDELRRLAPVPKR